MTVPELVHYLTVHARWAANSHGAFVEFAADMRDLRATLEAATNRTRKPTKAGAQCFECSGTLRREVDEETGLERDSVTCRDCREEYPPQRYALALANAAQDAAWIERDGEQWATPAALSRELGRPENTLHRWRRDGQVRATHVDRVAFFSVEDAEREHLSRQTRQVSA